VLTPRTLPKKGLCSIARPRCVIPGQRSKNGI